MSGKGISSSKTYLKSQLIEPRDVLNMDFYLFLNIFQVFIVLSSVVAYALAIMYIVIFIGLKLFNAGVVILVAVLVIEPTIALGFAVTLFVGVRNVSSHKNSYSFLFLQYIV